MVFDITELKENALIHFVGIGGVSMNGIAELMKQSGFRVSGSDREESKITNKLEQEGIKIFIGQAKENITPDIDLVVFTGAIKKDNPEIIRATELGIECVERPVVLGAIMQEYACDIAISGTHGKTTTTAMISSILIHAKKDPTINVGAYLDLIDGTTRIGSKKYFVVEACEYRKSFLNFKPNIAVVNNIEADHLDFYKDIDDIIEAFKEFCNGVDKDGAIIAGIDDENVIKAVSCSDRLIVSFAIDHPDANFRAVDIVYSGGGSTFTVIKDGNLFGEIELSVPGRYNILNALSAIAVCDTARIGIEDIRTGFYGFGGAARRFQKRGEYNGCVLIDDYAHHPTEIKNTIIAAQECGKNRIYTILQPHTYSRTKALFDDFVSSMQGVDEVVVCDIYAAREPFDSTVSSEYLAIRMKAIGINAVYLQGFDEIADYYKGKIDAGDMLITIGAGNVCNILERFL